MAASPELRRGWTGADPQRTVRARPRLVAKRPRRTIIRKVPTQSPRIPGSWRTGSWGRQDGATTAGNRAGALALEHDRRTTTIGWDVKSVWFRHRPHSRTDVDHTVGAIRVQECPSCPSQHLDRIHILRGSEPGHRRLRTPIPVPRRRGGPAPRCHQTYPGHGESRADPYPPASGVLRRHPAPAWPVCPRH